MFTNAAFVELEGVFEGGALQRALGRGMNLGAIFTMLWVSTRKHHSEDLPTREDVYELIDRFEDSEAAFGVMIEAYTAAQPKSEEEEEEEYFLKDGVRATPKQKQEKFTWRRFLKQSVNAGLKPAEFWDMTPDEATIWIEGYEKRYEELGSMWARFNSALMNYNRQSKKQKTVKPADLWQTREDQRVKAEPNVISIEDRREAMQDLKSVAPKPTGFKRNKKKPE